MAKSAMSGASLNLFTSLGLDLCASNYCQRKPHQNTRITNHNATYAPFDHNPSHCSQPAYQIASRQSNVYHHSNQQTHLRARRHRHLFPSTTIHQRRPRALPTRLRSPNSIPHLVHTRPRILSPSARDCLSLYRLSALGQSKRALRLPKRTR